ncbi:hypothetical protein ACF06X_02875 [Streptomyces sp. NPDC015346]|uniref:hypothetical protein n=1 Tax=Streptomyces sp. NPDC015346 TaxID=3364954 RepID=UPI0036FA7970
MRRMRRMRGALVPAALLLAATGCGIQQTDVVEAGGGATVTVIPPGGQRMLLFLVDSDGRVRPVARSMGDPLVHWDTGPSSGTVRQGTPIETENPGGSGSEAALGEARTGAGKALVVLTIGPTDAERDAGLGSRLPDTGRSPVTILKQATKGGKTWITTSMPVRNLDPLAVQQLVCTIAYAENPTAPPEVVLGGPDGELPAARCE